MPRLIDADKLHYIPVYIVNDSDGNVKRAIVVFAKEIDKLTKNVDTRKRIYDDFMKSCKS